jgi:hypothetical protein
MKSRGYIGMTAAAYAACVLPPLAVTLYYFPLWIASSARCTMSGISLVFLIVSAGPIFKALSDRMKTPSSPVPWGIIAVLAYALQAIISQIFTISIVGFVASLAGSLVFKIRDKKYGKE